MDESRTPEFDAVPVGPFDAPPLELGRLVTYGFGPRAPGEITTATCEWMLTRLRELGIALGQHDREVTDEIAEDLGWDVAQVVLGWVARAAADRPPTGGLHRT